MKLIYAVAFAVILPFCGYSQYNSDNLKITYSRDEADIADIAGIADAPTSLSFAQLQLYPIYASPNFVDAHKNLGRFTTLHDAQQKKMVQITERVGGGTPAPVQINQTNEIPIVQDDGLNMENNDNVQDRALGGSSATVNTLFIENISADTVYIMAGEVVKGGRQDRVIAMDMVLPPNSGQIDLSVFCVEHGRWASNGNGNNFSTAGYFAPQSVRKEVEVSNNQQAVWNSVAVVNKVNETTTNSDALTANEDNEKFQKELKGYLDDPALKDLANGNPMVVGVVAVSGDKVIGCDIFATHQLFASQYPSLLHSYASEAVTNGASVKMTETEVQKYLSQFLDNEDVQEKNLEGKGKVYKFDISPGNSTKTRISTY